MTGAERQAAYRKRHPERVAAAKRVPLSRRSEAYQIGARNRVLRSRFGITYDDLARMHAEQGGVCAICGRPLTIVPGRQGASAHVDHDHATGEIRGLLCTGCNAGIGHLQDDPGRLLAAAAYLTR